MNEYIFINPTQHKGVLANFILLETFNLGDKSFLDSLILKFEFFC